jgi:glycosyltransferase involved in cell wall biosynthesis
MSPPRVDISVVIPAYDSADFIGDAIGSVLDQVGVRSEVIVVDDGSTDGTDSVARSFDGSTTVIRHDRNRGAAAARNTGLAAVSTDLVLFLDSDDWLLPGALAALIEASASRLDAAVLMPSVRVTDLDGTTVVTRVVPAADGPIDLHDVLARRRSPTNLVAVRPSRLGGAPLFRPGSLVEDLELWINAAKRGVIAVGVPDAEAVYRGRPDSVSKRVDDIWRSSRRVYLDPSSRHPDCSTCLRAAREGVARLRDYCFGLDLVRVFGGNLPVRERARRAAGAVRRDPVLAPRLGYAAGWRIRDHLMRTGAR